MLNQLSRHEDTVNGHLNTIDGQKSIIFRLQDSLDKHKQIIKGNGNAKQKTLFIYSSPWRICYDWGEIFVLGRFFYPPPANKVGDIVEF